MYIAIKLYQSFKKYILLLPVSVNIEKYIQH